MIAAGIAAGVSVVLASLAFVAEYALGGVGDASIPAVLTAMGGVHALIGIGEGVTRRSPSARSCRCVPISCTGRVTCFHV